MHIYLITNLINGKQYVGAEKNGNNPEYFGSGKLIIEAIEKFGKENFKKEILIDNKYIDNWEECLELESVCILSLNTLEKFGGYNMIFWNWPIPAEILREGGSKGGKIAAKRNQKNQKAIFDLGRRKKEGWNKKGGKISGKIVGKRNKELKRGIFAPGMQKKGGEKTYELGVGAHAPGMASKGGKIAAKRNQKNQKAIFAPEVASKGGKNKAHVLFETDELIQQTTLGAILKG